MHLVHVMGRILIVAVGFAACGDTDDELSGSPFAGVPERELQQAFELGGVEVPEEESWRREPQLAVDREGFLYVLHRDLGRVGVFDGAGEFVHWIGGGEGEGPGEFTSAGGLGFVGDTLWVRNLTPPRISRFLRDGTHVEDDRVQVEAEYRTTMGIQGISGYLQGGRAWMVPDGSVMRPHEEAPFTLGDREMGVESTLFTWRAARGTLAGTGFSPFPEPPFHDVAGDGSGVVLAEWSNAQPEDLLVRFYSPDGAEAESWTLDVPAIPVERIVRDSVIQAGRDQVSQVRERVIQQGIPPESAPAVPTAGEVEEAAYLPQHYPPIRGVRAGLDGTVWLERTDRMGSGGWVAFDSDGAALFQVQLPEGAHLREASRSAIWATTTDEHDVPYVVRWNVVEAPPGS